ncbi:MAG: hypothetical protein AAF587_05730 [Bacteroidota bacterium]
MKAGKIYRRAIKRNLKPYFANWLPGDSRELGEYGEFKGGIFRPIGNVKDFGVEFIEKIDPSPDNHEFGASGAANVNFYAKGKLDPSANAAMEIAFTKEWAVYFKAIDARANRIADKNDLGKQILTLYKSGKWKRRWVIITDVVSAGRTITAVSASNDSRIVLEAAAEIETINPVDASIELQATISSRVGYQVSGAAMQPLIGFSKVQMRFFTPVFRAKALPATTRSTVAPYLDSPELVQVRPEDLFFGQLMNDDTEILDE